MSNPKTLTEPACPVCQDKNFVRVEVPNSLARSYYRCRHPALEPLTEAEFNLQAGVIPYQATAEDDINAAINGLDFALGLLNAYTQVTGLGRLRSPMKLARIVLREMDKNPPPLLTGDDPKLAYYGRFMWAVRACIDAENRNVALLRETIAQEEEIFLLRKRVEDLQPKGGFDSIGFPG